MIIADKDRITLNLDCGLVRTIRIQLLIEKRHSNKNNSLIQKKSIKTNTIN